MAVRSLQTDGAVIVTTGASVTLTAQEVIIQGASEYTFSKWTVGGVDAGTDLTLVLTANTDKAVEAVYVASTSRLVFLSDGTVGESFGGFPDAEFALFEPLWSYVPGDTDFHRRQQNDVITTGGTYAVDDLVFRLVKSWTPPASEPAGYDDYGLLATLDTIAVKKGWTARLVNGEETLIEFEGGGVYGTVYVSNALYSVERSVGTAIPEGWAVAPLPMSRAAFLELCQSMTHLIVEAT